MTITFSPQSWDDGARRVAGSAEDFASTAQQVLGNCTDLGRLGCQNGGTLADAALCMVFPPLFNAVQETVNGISQGLQGEAGDMMATGAAYRMIEETNQQIASQIGGE